MVHQARRGGVGVAVHVHLLLPVHVEVAGALVLVAVGAVVAALGAGVWQRVVGVVALTTKYLKLTFSSINLGKVVIIFYIFSFSSFWGEGIY